MRLLLVSLFALLTLRPAAAEPPAEPAKPRVKLAVLVVFDQMRGDYVDKWRPLFGPDGFARLQSEGAWFKNCYYPYAVTQTGPGHASMLTGTCPDRHGIVTNEWYDAKPAEEVSCPAPPRNKPAPPLPKVVVEEPKDEKADPKKPAKPKSLGT